MTLQELKRLAENLDRKIEQVESSINDAYYEMGRLMNLNEEFQSAIEEYESSLLDDSNKEE